MKVLKIIAPLLIAGLMLTGCDIKGQGSSSSTDGSSNTSESSNSESSVESSSESFSSEPAEESSLESSEGSSSEEMSSEESSSEGLSSEESSGGSSTSEEGSGEWSKDIQEEMMLYLGEVLPFVQLDEATLVYGYTLIYDYFPAYVLYDDSEVDLFEGYGDKLIEAGYVYNESWDSYDKEALDLSVEFGWLEATEDTPAGNFITVYCPEYMEPITEDLLIEEGYTKVTGWPTAKVDAVVDGSGVTIPSINEEGEWYYLEGSNSNDYGTYLYILLVTKGEYAKAYDAKLTAADILYDEDYDAYYDINEEIEVALYENNGFTVIEVYGPYLDSGNEGAVSEVTNLDGTITSTFDFTGFSSESTASVDGTLVKSTSASVSYAKGTGGVDPKYYYNGDSIRVYPGNTITISALNGATLNEVNISLDGGSLSSNISSYTVSSGEASLEDGVFTVTDIDASTLTIGVVGSSGHIRVASIEVTVTPAEYLILL